MATEEVPEQVRNWLTSTFSRQSTRTRLGDEKPRFRSIVQALRTGLFIDRWVYKTIIKTLRWICDDDLFHKIKMSSEDDAKILNDLNDLKWLYIYFHIIECFGGRQLLWLHHFHQEWHLFLRWAISKFSKSQFWVFLFVFVCFGGFDNAKLT